MQEYDGIPLTDEEEKYQDPNLDKLQYTGNIGTKNRFSLSDIVKDLQDVRNSVASRVNCSLSYICNGYEEYRDMFLQQLSIQIIEPTSIDFKKLADQRKMKYLFKYFGIPEEYHDQLGEDFKEYILYKRKKAQD